MMSELANKVREVVDHTPVLDIHTHLFRPSFGLTLWGIDEILTYHYLVAETMRFADTTPQGFFAMPKPEQADLVWDTLFVRNTPISEATAGVVTILDAFGLDSRAPDLQEARAFFAAQDPAAHIENVLRLSGVESVVMTNDPLDEREASLWEANLEPDPRFHAALRIDPLLNGWPEVGARLQAKEFAVGETLDEFTLCEVRRFLEFWVARMRPLYMAVSLPPTFRYPEESDRIRLLTQAVLPVCREHGLPFAMMNGVRKAVNPSLGDAGDSVGLSDIGAIERICCDYPKNRFLVTVLSRENQHSLCVAARKFANLLPFGCWWFMNNPSLVEGTTLMRLEMLGTSFVPQHSDARVLEQLIYKWKHSRRDIANALTRRYEALSAAGREVEHEEIKRDALKLLRDNAVNWTSNQPVS